jgi:hypothetical protein
LTSSRVLRSPFTDKTIVIVTSATASAIPQYRNSTGLGVVGRGNKIGSAIHAVPPPARRSKTGAPERQKVITLHIISVAARRLDPVKLGLLRHRRARSQSRAPGHGLIALAARRCTDAGLARHSFGNSIAPEVVLGDLGIHQFGPDCPEPFQSSALVGADQPRIARDVGGEDRGEAAGLAHVASSIARRRPDRNRSRSSGLRHTKHELSNEPPLLPRRPVCDALYL